MFDKDNKFGFIINNNNSNNSDNSDIKKYIDDKVTVKILPVDVDKNYATNVADLEANSIYMSPNDAKFLYLGYEKLNGSFSGFYITSKPHGKFVYTGFKDDSKIEIVIEGTCYTAYFKTDTEDAHTERTVYYLTKNNTTEYTPTADYHPATKKYVDDEIYSKGLREYVGTKENPVLFTEIKNGWNIVKNYYKWYAEYENSIPCGTMLVHKCPAGKNFYITYMNGAELTRYGYNATTHMVKGYNHVLSNEVLTTDNTIEYTPTNDYNPATKKYVDDSLNNILSFNENGELVVTINGVSKTFVPKSE